MSRRSILLAAALAALAVAFFVLRPPPTTGPPLRDFESYYAAGTTWRYEGDPYGREVWRTERTIPQVVATRDELLPFVGPPFGLPLWSAIARLPWPTAVFVWETVLVAALVTIAFGSLRLAGGAVGTVDVIAAFVLAAGFGPLTSGVALGQVAVVACAAIVAVPFALRPRWLAAAFCAACVAALQPNLAIVLAARLAERRSWLAFVCAAVFVLGASALTLGGMGGFAHYLDVLRAHGAAERFIAIQIEPAAIARALGASAASAGVVGIVIAAVVVTVVAGQCLSRRYLPTARLALAGAALPLALPFGHEHDLAIVFLPAMLTLRSARGITWVACACGTLLAATDWLGLAQRPTGVAETASLTLAAALACVLLARGLVGPRHFVPVLIAGAVLVAAHLVAAHPLPTWPDGLGANYRVSERLPAAEVWRLEQERSGITRLEPAWGWLRATSLGGCALLWFAASIALSGPRAARERPA